MKAVVADGRRQVSIERATDVLIRITTTDMCCSDLHMYEGRIDFKPRADVTTSRSPDQLPAFCERILQEFAATAATPAGRGGSA